VKLGLSTRERAAIAAVMHRGVWGGERAILVAQAGVYRALKLADFVGKDGATLARSSLVDRTMYELPDDAGEVLASILCAGGQSAEIALLNAGVLERLDPVAAAAALGAEEVTAVTPAAAGALPTNNKHKRKGAPRL